MKYEAVVSDLDGTLWAGAMEVHPATLASIHVLDSNRVPLLIATGRRAQSALHGLRRVNLHDRPGVLMNGALARDQLSGESFLSESIDADDAMFVYDTFMTAGLEPLAYVDHPVSDVVVGAAPSAGPDYLSSAPGLRRSSDLAAEIESEPIIGFGAFGFGRDQLDPIAEAINEAGAATAIVGASVIEGDYALMVQGAGIDKQTAIEAWCERSGIDVSRLAVLGDGANDELMLRAAALAIVPTSAPPEIRELADVLIPPPEDGGWAELSHVLGIS